MKEKIKIHLGMAALFVMLANNLYLALSDYKMATMPLPDFFYQQTDKDLHVDRKNELEQFCRTTITTKVDVEDNAKDSNTIVLHLRRSLIQETW